MNKQELKINSIKMPKKDNKKIKLKKIKSNVYINKMLENDNHTLNFTEKVNVNKAKRLLRLTDKEFLDYVYDEGEIKEDGSAWSPEYYIKQVKRFLHLAVESKGIVKQKYKYSKGLLKKQVGRIYVDKFGVQSLQAKIRGFVSGEYYNDLDMKNAFPTLLLYLAEKFFPHIKTKTLKMYVKKRDKLCEKYDTSKIEVLKWLNRDFVYTGENLLLKSLDAEFKLIQEAVSNSQDNDIINLVDRSLINSTNKKGSLLHRVLSIIENDILQGVIKEKKVGVPYFDGAFFEKEEDKDELIKEMNIYTEKYGIKWSHKEHSTLNIPEEEIVDSDDEEEEFVEEELYGYEFSSYADVKKRFEKNHFVIQVPFMVIKEYEDFTNEEYNKKCIKHEIYTKTNINDVYSNLLYQYVVVKPDGSSQTLDGVFLARWFKDPARRTYKKMDFNPIEDSSKIPKFVYNTFRGFSATLSNNEEHNQLNYKKHFKEVERFINHVSLLVNHHEESKNYVLNYFADLFQNPQNLPEVALVFKSKKGLGKDLLIHYLEKMLGENYVYRTSNLEEVYGNFNPAVKNKLLVQLNELQGKDGFAKKERLKDSITAKRLNVNEKNVKQFSILNAIRFIIFSNNLNPVEATSDNRRFAFFKGGEIFKDKAKKKEYYDPLFENLKNREIINAILYYFKNLNLTDFNIKELPETEAMVEAKEMNTPPIYCFLYNKLEFVENNAEFLFNKKTKKYMIETKKLHDKLSKYLIDIMKIESKLNFKVIKPLLKELNIVSARCRISGERGDYYIIDKTTVMKKLEEDFNLGVDNDEVLEFDDADFEDGYSFQSDDDEE